MITHFFSVLEDPVLFISFDGCQRRGACQRMTVLGQPGEEHLVVEELGDLFTHDDRT